MARGRGGGNRRQRVEAEMQRVLSVLISREVKDPRVGPVTVTAVEVAGDMGHARVFVLPFGDLSGAQGDAARDLIDGLTQAAGFLRGEVGRSLQLRHAPQLEFVIDESFDRAARLTRLIDDAVRDDAAKPSTDR